MHNTCTETLLDTPSFCNSTLAMAMSKENRRRLSSINLGLLIISCRKLTFIENATFFTMACRYWQIGDRWHIPLASSLEVDIPKYLDICCTCYPLIRTALLWITFFTSAASESVRPPTLLDIRDRLGCSTEEATYQFSVQAAGGLAGCLISGFLADRWQECPRLSTSQHEMFQTFSLSNLPVPLP